MEKKGAGPNRRHSSPGKVNVGAFKGHTMSQISNAKLAAKKLKHRQKQRRAKKAMVKRSVCLRQDSALEVSAYTA